MTYAGAVVGKERPVDLQGKIRWPARQSDVKQGNDLGGDDCLVVRTFPISRLPAPTSTSYLLLLITTASQYAGWYCTLGYPSQTSAHATIAGTGLPTAR